MDVSRSEKIAGVMKNITGLGKDIKRPTGLKYEMPGRNAAGVISRLPPPVQGSTTMRVLLYIVASVLLIGIILLGVDQWITPIFERKPGDGGYIPIPGVDNSEIFWTNTRNVRDIRIGIPDSSGNISSSLIENQSNYSIMMDILIENEYPQKFGNDVSGNLIIKRTLFLIGEATATKPCLSVHLDNTTNTLYITAYDSSDNLQSVKIDNVPIHKPFRIGISKSENIMEGYLNGRLVMTRPLKTSTTKPASAHKIFSTANIINNGNTLSSGIKVRNLRLFGYTVPASEMTGRMTDLAEPSVFI
jgi:hypothetical protein